MKKLKLYSFAIFLILTTQSFADAVINIDIFTGKYYKKTAYVPQIAVWTEDINGNIIETLYVTEAEGKNKYFGVRKRKEALPVWRNKVIKSKSKSNLDGVAGASHQNSFKISKNIDDYPKNFNVFLEVNKSFDYNSFFQRGLNSRSKGYNSGYSGQPSVIYQSSFTKTEKGKQSDLKKMKVIGHGSATGANGKITNDISNLTSALKILDKVTVKIQ